MDNDLKKTLKENKDKIISGAFLIIVLIVVISLHKEEVPKQTTATTTQTTQDKKKQDEQERIQKARANQDSYGQLLDGGKTYEQMSSDERKTADNLIIYWGDLEQTFRDKYKTQYDTLTTNKASYLKAKADKAAAQKAADEAKKKEENRASYDTGITYDQLARTPDDYKYKKAKFTGKVVQVLEDGGQTDLRLAVNGNYDNMLYISYISSIVKSRVLENDNITVRGVSYGIYTYTSTFKSKISIPMIMADEITINDK